MFFRAKIGYAQLFCNALPDLQCNIPVIWSKSFSVIFIFNFLPFTPLSMATTSFPPKPVLASTWRRNWLPILRKEVRNKIKGVRPHCEGAYAYFPIPYWFFVSVCGVDAFIETRRMLQPKLFRQVFSEAVWNETRWVYGTKIVIWVIYSLFWRFLERKIVILQTKVKLFNFW